MKVKVALSLVLVVLTTALFSQNKPFRFGVLVAPNVAWMSPDSEDYENDGALPGFSWGFNADITLADNYFVRTGFTIDYLNSKLKYPHQQMINESDVEMTPGTLNRKYNLSYLEVPLTVKMRTNKFGKVAYFGEIGFGFAFNLKAKAKDDFSYNEGQNSIESEGDIKDEINLFKASLKVGGGIEYYLDDSTSLFFSLNYNNGLSNVLKGTNTLNTAVEQRTTLNFFALNIGIIF